MISLYNLLFLRMFFLFLLFKSTDPRVRNMLFMSNPFTIIALLTVYLCFILKWGPNYMKNRKPFNLNKLIIVYNILQIVACARLVIQVNIFIFSCFIYFYFYFDSSKSFSLFTVILDKIYEHLNCFLVSFVS